MLQAQVNYWTLVENARHNRETEDISRANIGLGYEQLRFSYANLDENKRHNRATEELGFQTLAETSRHNLVTERQGDSKIWLQTQELSETIRSHRANENINMQNVQVAQANANSNRLQALNAAQKTEYDNANTQYKNRTDRINAYTNQRNSYVNEMNAYTNQRNANTKEAELPSKYLGILNLIK